MSGAMCVPTLAAVVPVDVAGREIAFFKMTSLFFRERSTARHG